MSGTCFGSRVQVLGTNLHGKTGTNAWLSRVLSSSCMLHADSLLLGLRDRRALCSFCHEAGDEDVVACNRCKKNVLHVSCFQKVSCMHCELDSHSCQFAHAVFPTDMTYLL